MPALKVTTLEESPEEVGKWTETSTAIVSQPADLDLSLGKGRRVLVEEAILSWTEWPR